ncbi:SusC/RagA family TonB-linked outer membrane protein [Lutibacter sp. A64]|uniref:SusC/RagA family TonB-linked outer membrane protein n=1 Tax=Lutibacter sp. A64 TaxID=2918526 RepID=UPI001F05EEE8|nr:SusC/RagA family TonB-linked outer membrane protein [Lutibacter sp. A64]UMB52498.1 SusC/RagA family TonB-linked outer membrane protein [Lutibacter sp. A64]
MKRSLILSILFSSITAFSFSQKITINMGKVSLHEALKEIKKETNIDFFYSDRELNTDRVVLANFIDTDIEEAISKLVGKTYKIQKNEEGILLITPIHSVNFQNEITIKGVITDEFNNPLPGVTILVKGTKQGTTSDFDGNYTIKADKESTLVFSYVGYNTQEVSVNGKTEINVQLKTAVAELDEVVVTGIIERQKETYTGAVTTISGNELKEIGNQNIIQSIKTIEPSFLVLENNIQGANPNILPTIEVRGQTSISTEDLRDEYDSDPNSPLFVLDGFETTLRTIVDLDMNRVESITILKDAASTALYGSKAANGVVVVETKKSKDGELNISYTGDFSVDIPDLSDYNLMNAEEKLEFERLSGRWTYYSVDPAYQIPLDSAYNAKLADIKRGVDTYWLNEPVQTAFTQRHSVYVDGGSDALRFSTGLSYRDNEGVMKGSGRDIWSGNIDLTYRKNKINITNRLYVSGSMANESNYGSFEKFAQANPYYKKYNDENEITRHLETSAYGNYVRGYYGYNIVNPLYSSTLNNIDETNGFSVQNNLASIWTINNNLRVQAGIQLKKSTTENEVFISPEETIYDNVSFFEKGEYTNAHSENFSYVANAMLVYHNLFNKKHSLTGNLRAEIEEQNNESYTTKAVGFPSGSNGKPSFSFSYDLNAKPNFYTNKYRRNNVMASVNYSFDKKYFIDLNYRLDGSTAFGSKERYSPFWSAGLGWNLHNNFGIKGDVINVLRLRQTLGYTGNQNLGSVASTSVYTYNSLINYYGAGAKLTQYANADLEWQRTFDTNLGLDLVMFNNKLDAQFNLYNKNTNPLVVPIDLASSTGLVNYPLNVGKLKVNGWEAVINYKIINNLEDQLF